MFRNSEPYRLRFHFIAVIFFLTVYIPLFTSCSPFSSLKKTTKKITRSFKGSSGGLNLKIGITPFRNATFFVNPEFEETLNQTFAETISKECPDILALKPGDDRYPDILANLPMLASGRIDNIAMVTAGRQLGLNAIVISSLINLTEKREKRGVLWFKDFRFFVQTGISLEIYDTETGAKVLDESFIREIEVEETDFELLKTKNNINLPAATDALMDITRVMGVKTCDIISDQIWQGYVISVTGDKIFISSGEKVGLVPGKQFAVYDSGNIVEGIGGHRFFIPGNKTGKIKIISVYPDRSEALALSNQGIKEGNSVRLK
jgi:hypothetical protein